MKKAGKRIGIIILVILLIVAAYLVYVMVSYHRLPDKLTLEVNRTGNQAAFEEDRQVEVGKYYWIMTYNIGFGAYRNDYSFFMDGGRSSWAKDEESVTAGICGMGDIVNTVNPDFVLMQEVDIDGTRSYHVNELELMNQFVTGYYYTFAENYDSPFLFFPPWEPHGANQAGIVTYSRSEITDTMRRSLPISQSFSRFLDLDRCYSISRIPLDVHLSAYGADASVRDGQLAMLYEDMKADYKEGNYIICGGDFNHNMKQTVIENTDEWAQPFPRESLPEGFRLAIDSAKAEDIEHNSCRDNVGVNYYTNMDWRYELSDHDPVLMQFMLLKSE